MKTTELKGIMKISPGWLAITTTGLHEDVKNKNLSEHNNAVVFVTVQDEKEYKTIQQNSFFHKLIEIYFHSQQFDFSEIYGRPPKNTKELKIDIKFRLGHDSKEIHTSVDLVGLPYGEFIEVSGRVTFLKSWSVYTKKQARETIDSLMLEMAQKGISLCNERVIYQEIYNKELPIF